jgi:xanthine dehydrogenase accessory factor
VERVVLDAGGIRWGSLGDPAADAELAGLARDALGAGASRIVRAGGREVFLEVLAAARLVIAGAGEIAVYLVRLAHAIGLQTVVMDPRAAFLTRERFPDADQLLPGWADELADLAGIELAASVVALAHDPKIDDPAIITALRRGAFYVGALGSRRTHAQRLARLREAGLDDADLARIHAPVGLDLGGHTPADIALGILAEIVAQRHAGHRAASTG